LWFRKQEVKAPGIVGMSLQDSGVALCYGLMEAGEFLIKAVEYAPITGAEQISYVKGWVARHRLKNADCVFVLNEDDYELELLEAPPVDDAELKQAVKWKLKDLIQMPIDKAAIDVFRLPDDAYRGRMKMLYAVAADKDIVEQRLRFIRRCDLTPAVVDIPEMSLRNICMHLPEMEHGTVALLDMKESQGAMMMYSHDALYLTRQIEMGYSSFAAQPGGFSLDNGVMVERLSLDLQRSLDYYESQLGKGIANRIYLLPLEEESVHFTDDLQPSIATPIMNFDARECLPFEDNVNPSVGEQAYCLTVMGAVLRGSSYAAG